MVYVFPIERDSQKAIIGGAVVFSLLPTTAVLLRLVARSRLKDRNLDLSDWLIILACVSFFLILYSSKSPTNEMETSRSSPSRTKHSPSPAPWSGEWGTT